ncbi:MAG: type I DNA topoisomerase [Deltaproteobacteria bacterium]|jgi:DNA topoisomerase-1|nr:type I DNA topoisomerase [Deltaproteobacteria bacterium]
MSKSLIIVESPAKARTLKKYLGKDYDVRASVGHIRDLPVNSLGVDIKENFAPRYVTIKGKSKIISDLKKAAASADEVFLAPDPDREGEAIAWHIAHILQTARKPIHRALFHELTPKAIRAAIENATSIDDDKFQAQQARRVLDRLVGYQISPLLWEKVRRGLSAGRVQSVAVRMICDREKQINAFTPVEYWTISTRLKGKNPPPFVAKLDKIAGRKAKVDNEEAAAAIVANLKKAAYSVAAIDKKERRRNPSPPFITSTLQQEANRKLRYTAKRTMGLAQKLYEGIELGEKGPVGLITYMRTDSTRINDDALTEVRRFINGTYGKEYLPAKPVTYKTSKSSQDAHEAIRPTDVSLTPEKVAPFLDKSTLNLYTLVWKRFVASQMRPALFDQTTITIKADIYLLKAQGAILRFKGFMALYVESTDENGDNNGQATEADGEGSIIPDVAAGEKLQFLDVEPKQNFTQPPPRYTEATLVKALEENGVGRPSTYAAIISTILDKEYVMLEKRKFMPTDLGGLVNDLLVHHFPDILNIEFTASMEKDLDLVEEGRSNWVNLLQDFYTPFEKTLAQAKREMKSVKREGIPTGISCKLCDGKLVIKLGKAGEFLACENYPTCKHTQNFKKDESGTVIPIEKEEPVVSGEKCEKCGRPMVYKHGRFGKFLACSGYPECRHIKAQTTGVKCPEENCSGELVQKISKRGKVFYSCSRFPACKFASWDKPVPTKCPGCGKPFLLEKTTRKGTVLQCIDKACGYSEPLA